jgi:predicted molibdopterin-dependent oxidoreductase YjgC
MTMLFRRVGAAPRSVTVYFDDKPISCMEGDSIAAALLAQGIVRFRSTPVSGAPRMPYCMIGNCFDCLVEIDGTRDRQACLIPVVEGMRIRTQEEPRQVDRP